jgi:hypothetical protein
MAITTEDSLAHFRNILNSISSSYITRDITRKTHKKLVNLLLLENARLVLKRSSFFNHQEF